VNNEDLSKNNDEPTKNNVKIKQLVTQKRSKKDDTLRTQNHQQTPKIRQYLNFNRLRIKQKQNRINSKVTFKITAKKGKSIIPARRLFPLNHHYGSPMNIDSLKELGPLDNTSKNTKLKTQYYLNETLINTSSSTSPNKSSKNHQTHQPYK